MDIMIIATRDCSHYRNLVKELDHLGIQHRLVFAEDNPELTRNLGIRHSPNLVIDGEVRFRRLPTEQELRECFKCETRQ